MFSSFLKTTRTKEFKMMLNLNAAFLKISVFVSIGRIFGACENGTTASSTVKIFPTTASSFSLPTIITPTSSLVSSFHSTSATVMDTYQTPTLNPSFTSSELSTKISSVFTTMSTRTGFETLSSSFLPTIVILDTTSITAYDTDSLSSSFTSHGTSIAPLQSNYTSTDTDFSTRVTASQIYPAQVSAISVTSSTVMSSTVVASSSITSTTPTTTTAATTTKKPATMRATDDDEKDRTLVLGLSVGFSVVVVAVGSAIVIVIFCTRNGDRNTSSSKSSSSSKRPEYTDDTKSPPDDGEVSSLDSSSSESYRKLVMKRRSTEDTVEKTVEKIVSAKPKEQRERIPVSSDFVEFKRNKNEERKRRLEEAVAQKRVLYLKPSRDESH